MEERWDNLAVRKVTRCTEENHHMRVGNALNAKSGAQWVLRPLLRRRLSRFLAESKIANCCVPLRGRLRTHSDFTEWPPN
jgi:hypothetical protein